MDADVEWEPVIGHMPIAYPDGKVTYDGYSLYINDHHYCENVEPYLPSGPILTKRGQIAKNQPPKPQKKAHTWWKAQCVFRGLSPKGTIAQLQDRLKGHEKSPACSAIRDLEALAKQEYKVKNNAAVEDKWVHKMSGEEKEATDPRRYLGEAFPAGEKCTGVIVLKSCHSGWALALAKELGLEAERVEPPQEKGMWTLSVEEYWVVVGQQKSAVTEKVRTISKATQREKDEAQQKQDAYKRAKEAIARKKQQDLEEALAKCKDWDVTGTYKISCPYVEKTWGNIQQRGGYLDEGSSQLTLQIFLERTPKGPQMFAKFNFLVTAGVIRFERQQDDVIMNGPKEDKNKKRKREDDEDEYDRWKYGLNKRSPTPEAFYFGSIPQPSAKHQSWNYRWRGNSGESLSRIELGVDNKLYTMKFFGPRVEKLEGTFGGGIFEDCTFEGIKVGVGNELNVDIAEEWADRNEHAYDRACRRAWGGW